MKTNPTYTVNIERTIFGITYDLTIGYEFDGADVVDCHVHAVDGREIHQHEQASYEPDDYETMYEACKAQYDRLYRD